MDTSSNHSQRSDDFCLRRASAVDIPQVYVIDASATKKFASIPELADLAENEEEPAKIQHWLNIGRVFLAEQSGQPVGFVAAYPIDGCLYIAELSVLSSRQGKGIGSCLLNVVFQWARERCVFDRTSIARVFLTTYADVPWNGSWYRRRGFKEADPAILGPSHVEIMAEDIRLLDRPDHRRCCMLWEYHSPLNASTALG